MDVAPSLQRNTPKDVVNGIALSSIIQIASLHLFFVGVFGILVCPLPILYYRFKCGRRIGLLIAGAAFLLAAAVLERSAADHALWGMMMLLGFVLGELFVLNPGIEWTVAASGGSACLAGLAGLAVYALFNERSIGGLANDYVAQHLAVTLEAYRKMGVSSENVALLADSLETIQYILVRIIPGLGISASWFVAWCNLMLARPVLRLKGFSTPDFGRLNRWRAPEQLVWGVIGCGALLLLPLQGLKIMGLNGLIILLTVYFFQGLAIVAHFFDRKNIPAFLRVILYSLIFLQQVVLIFVIGLGFFDIWLNFRKLDRDPGGSP